MSSMTASRLKFLLRANIVATTVFPWKRRQGHTFIPSPRRDAFRLSAAFHESFYLLDPNRNAASSPTDLLCSFVGISDYAHYNGREVVYLSGRITREYARNCDPSVSCVEEKIYPRVFRSTIYLSNFGIGKPSLRIFRFSSRDRGF